MNNLENNISYKEHVSNKKKTSEAIVKESEIYRRALDKWGFELQADILIEELSELLQATIKIKRYGSVNEYVLNFAEEIADVEIMLGQFKQAEILNDYVQEKKEKKLKRLELLLRDVNEVKKDVT